MKQWMAVAITLLLLSVGAGFYPGDADSGAILRSSLKDAGVHRERVARHSSPKRMTQPLTVANTVMGYPPPPIEARAAYLVDMRTGKELYSRNADERLPMASTTKITTAIVVLHHARVGELATVSPKAATIGESTMVLQPGERLTVKQLLYGLLLNSANDAAITLAEHVAGTEAAFVRLMNALARRLHMRNTHYVTSHGLDAPGHYTSARDLATVALYAMRNPTFREIVASPNYHIRATRHNHEHWLANINRVMFWFPGVDGVKPGDTDDAGLCQVVSAWRNGRHLLAVVLNTPTLVTDVRNLLNYGSRDFQWVQAPAYWDAPANAITGGRGTNAWAYYLGAGHSVRGPFLTYWHAHGNLSTFGYPRTEELVVGGRTVQYFQGGELIEDESHGTVYPEELGLQAAYRLVPRAVRPRAALARLFAAQYNVFGGKGVLGDPVTGVTIVRGYSAQFYQYGALVATPSGQLLLPVGDLDLRYRHWLPASGTPDAAPATLASGFVD